MYSSTFYRPIDRSLWPRLDSEMDWERGLEGVEVQPLVFQFEHAADHFLCIRTRKIYDTSNKLDPNIPSPS